MRGRIPLAHSPVREGGGRRETHLAFFELNSQYSGGYEQTAGGRPG